jgi:hypothetical protein
MIRGCLWVAIAMLALTTCGGTQAPRGESAAHSPAASDAPSADSGTSSTTEDSEPTGASSDQELLDEWAKRTNGTNGTGADPFPDDVVGFALGMDEAKVRQVCAEAKGEILISRPLRCTFDSVLREVFKGTALWLDEPGRGWLDGGVSVEFDGDGRVCGISAGLSGSDVGSVVPPSDLVGKLGFPLKVLDARGTRIARWHWPGEEHEAFAGWSHHLPSYRGSGGQRQWVSYCKRTNSDCRTFCSYLE